MALVSRMKTICDAIATVLNDDPDISDRNWRVRKKPYTRGNHWEPGAWIAPVNIAGPYHENSEDELIFRVRCVVVDPEDADLTANMAEHLGAIERVAEIFRAKSHGNAPAGLRSINTTLTGENACVFQKCDVEFEGQFIDPAFEAGFDASSVVIAVHVTVSPRRNSSSLGA